MATDRIERELRRRLREVLGDVAAMALFEKFPPDGGFTRLEARLDHLETRFDGLETRFDGLETRFDGLETRFDGLERRFDGLERRFDGLEHRLEGQDAKFEVLEHRMTAVFRKELNDAITAQTRTVMFSLLGSIVSVGALALAMQQLAV